MSGFRIKGPRFALTNPETCRACIKCVYGNGEHAEWCERNPQRAETRLTEGQSSAPVQRETENAAEQRAEW